MTNKHGEKEREREGGRDVSQMTNKRGETPTPSNIFISDSGEGILGTFNQVEKGLPFCDFVNVSRVHSLYR